MLHIDDILFRRPVEIGSLLYLNSQVGTVKVTMVGLWEDPNRGLTMAKVFTVLVYCGTGCLTGLKIAFTSNLSMSDVPYCNINHA